MEKQTGSDEQYPWDAVARIAEARVLKVVIGWLFAVFTIVVTALGYIGWQTAKQRVDQYVDAQVDSSVLERLVEANIDSMVLAQVVETDIVALAQRQVEEAEAKLIVPREQQPDDRQVLSLDEPKRVRVPDSSDSTVVLALTVPQSAEYEITAVAVERENSMLDPIIAVMELGDDPEPVLVDLDDDGGDGFNSLLRVRLEQETNYELWVAGFLSAKPDTVTLTLRRVVPGT